MEVTRNILSKVGLLELNRFASSGRCLMVFDFDGTLAPIVNDPESAALDSQFVSDLLRLSHVYEILILTGRSVEDVRKRLPGSLVNILGNHGLEGNKRVTDDLLSTARNLTREWIEILRNRFSNVDGFFIEDKIYSLAIHFRNASVKTRAKSIAKSEVKRLLPEAHILDGKRVVNVIPPKLPDKYLALSSYMEDNHFEKALFVGDDITDNQIFKAKDHRILSVKIGQSKRLNTIWYLQNQKKMGKFVRAILSIRRE